MNGIGYYLDGNVGVPCDLLAACRMSTADNKRVAKTDLPNGYWVSTVFLGIDHNLTGRGGPVLFETMVFLQGSYADLECLRYRTWHEAERGHEEAVERWSRRRRISRLENELYGA